MCFKPILIAEGCNLHFCIVKFLKEMYTHGLSISNYGIYFNEDSTRTELVLLLRLKILHSLFLYEEFMSNFYASSS